MDQVTQIELKKRPKESKRIYYGPFPVYQYNDQAHRSYIVGRAHLNLMHRGCYRLNLNIEIFGKGRFPWFRKDALLDDYTIRLALPAVDDVICELKKKGVRIQKTNSHRWEKRRFKSGAKL